MDENPLLPFAHRLQMQRRDRGIINDNIVGRIAPQTYDSFAQGVELSQLGSGVAHLG